MVWPVCNFIFRENLDIAHSSDVVQLPHMNDDQGGAGLMTTAEPVTTPTAEKAQPDYVKIATPLVLRGFRVTPSPCRNEIWCDAELAEPSGDDT
jgi:hypothetical protein